MTRATENILEFYRSDPAISLWTKLAIEAGLKRDPCDMAHDAALLSRLFKRIADEAAVIDIEEFIDLSDAIEPGDLD
jgi:hypothetical protein